MIPQAAPGSANDPTTWSEEWSALTLDAALAASVQGAPVRRLCQEDWSPALSLERDGG
jgi:hypothetical protein